MKEIVERLTFIANNAATVIPEEIEEVCDKAATLLSTLAAVEKGGEIDSLDGMHLLNESEIAHWKAALQRVQNDGTVLPPGSNVLCMMALAALRLRAHAIGAAKNEARWHAFCALWAASTVLHANQDESGFWVIRQIEPAEEITFRPLVGDTPNDAIDHAITMSAAIDAALSAPVAKGGG